MKNKSEVLKIDFDSCFIMLDNTVRSDPRCQEALKKFNNTLETLKGKNLTKKETSEIGDALTYREAAIQEIIYKKAFQDGMRFILNTMTGREVIEISD